MGWDLIVEFLHEVWQKKYICETDVSPIKHDVVNYFGFDSAYDAFFYTITLYKKFAFDKRKNGDPWPIHELEVAKVLSDAYCSEDAVLSGFNHDKPEDIFKKRRTRLDELLRVSVIPDLDEGKKMTYSNNISSLRNILYNEAENPELKSIAFSFGDRVSEIVALLSNEYFIHGPALLNSEGNLGYMKSEESYIRYVDNIRTNAEKYDFIPLEVKLGDHINHLRNIDGIDHDIVYRAIKKTAYVIDIAYNLQLSYGELPSSTQSLLNMAEDTLQEVRKCNLIDLPKNKEKITEANNNTDYILDNIQRIRKD